MRSFNYPLDANDCFLCDRYGNKRGSFGLKNGENTLPLSNQLYYKDSFGNVFYLYDGEGVLEWEDTLQYLDFSTLLVRDLDYFLCYLKYHCNTMPNTKKQIEQFLKVYDKNIQKGVVYLAPNGFLEVEYKLIGGCNG